MKTKIFKEDQQLIDFMLKFWQAAANKAIRQRGAFFAALAGGKTPRQFYKRLADHLSISVWEKSHIFLSDEHFVPFKDKHSNFRMLKETLLSGKNIPAYSLHPIYVNGLAKASAKLYENELKQAFGLRPGELPVFDIVLLGIGENGHTASLLPGNPALKEKKRLVVSALDKAGKQYRVTLTFPVINNARQVVFLVTGKSKAQILKEILVDKRAVPAALVKPKNKKLLYVLDKAAARFLQG